MGRGDELYLTGGISGDDPNTTMATIHRFTLVRSGSTLQGLTGPQTVLVGCPFPRLCQEQPALCGTHIYVATITGLACDRQTGTIFGTGLTMPWFAADAQWTEDIDLDNIYSTPFFFTIGPEDDVTTEPIQAAELSEALYPAPPLPISLTWTGSMEALPCGGADLTLDGGVSLPDLAIFASHWLRSDCESWRDCDAANVADGDGRSTVDLSDLAVLAGHWLNGSCP